MRWDDEYVSLDDGGCDGVVMLKQIQLSQYEKTASRAIALRR